MTGEKNILKLYHGTRRKDLDRLVDLKKRNDLDFGNGVYLTSNFWQAKKWACKKRKYGAVYECEMDFSKFKVLELTNVDDFNYLCYLCRIGLENSVAVETIDNFGDVDIVSGLMISGPNVFKNNSEIFNEGDLDYEQFKKMVTIHKNNMDQFCFKSEYAIEYMNSNMKKKYIIEKRNKFKFDVIDKYELEYDSELQIFKSKTE